MKYPVKQSYLYPKYAAIKKALREYFDITNEYFESKMKTGELVEYRCIFYHLASVLYSEKFKVKLTINPTTQDLRDLGFLAGGRDRTTVLYGIARCTDFIETDAIFRDKYSKLYDYILKNTDIFQDGVVDEESKKEVMLDCIDYQKISYFALMSGAKINGSITFNKDSLTTFSSKISEYVRQTIQTSVTE